MVMRHASTRLRGGCARATTTVHANVALEAIAITRRFLHPTHDRVHLGAHRWLFPSAQLCVESATDVCYPDYRENTSPSLRSTPEVTTTGSRHARQHAVPPRIDSKNEAI